MQNLTRKERRLARPDLAHGHPVAYLGRRGISGERCPWESPYEAQPYLPA
jgi:hypothetical protein